MCAARLMTGLLAALAATGVGDLACVPDAEVLRRAEEAFQKGAAVRADHEKARPQFARAADLYEALRRRGADNADLHRNQGRANLLAGRLPEAVLAYRRGLRCAPHDRELRDDLEYARDQVAYPGLERHGRPDEEPWPSWLPRIGAGVFLGVALALYALACCCATRGLTAARPQLLGRAAALVALAVAVGGLWTYLKWRAWSADRDPVVVIAEERVALRRGNGPTYPEHAKAPPLRRGMEAGLLHRRGGWLQIRLAGGEVGWVPASATLVED